MVAAAIEAGGFELTPGELLAATRSTVRAAEGRVPVVAGGVGFGSTAGTKEWVARLAEAGVDAVRVLPPRPAYPLMAPAPDEVRAHLLAVLDAAPCPILLASDPSLVAFPPTSVAAEVLTHPALAGLAVTGGSFLELVWLLTGHKPSVPVLVGDVRHQLLGLELGAAGTISRAAAADPEAALALHAADREGALAAQARLLRASAE